MRRTVYAMILEDDHLSDTMLLLNVDGELSLPDEKRVRAHLGTCWRCRARGAELERAIAEFLQAQHERFEESSTSADGPRALLRARMAASARSVRRSWLLRGLPDFAWIAVCAILILSLALVRIMPLKKRQHSQSAVVSAPNLRLTPGATILADKAAVCAAPDIKNKLVPPAVRERVFATYGISGNDAAAYEVDYLITPALGGADDIHNLWPHSYDAAWNAHVKDQLEDRLRDLVCGGNLDLQTAQRDIATDWVSTYKKVFHTDAPLGGN